MKKKNKSHQMSCEKSPKAMMVASIYCIYKKIHHYLWKAFRAKMSSGWRLAVGRSVGCYWHVYKHFWCALFHSVGPLFVVAATMHIVHLEILLNILPVYCVIIITDGPDVRLLLLALLLSVSRSPAFPSCWIFSTIHTLHCILLFCAKMCARPAL